VISVDTPKGVMTVKGLVSGKPVLVRTNSDSRMHRLPPFLARMIAGLNSGRASAGTGQESGPAGGAHAGSGPGQSFRGGPTAGSPAGQPRMPARLEGAFPGGSDGNGPPDIQQMLEDTPALTLSEPEPGDALIVLSTEGAKPGEVTAITVLAGVEPILAALPKGSDQMVLGPWNMGGGEGGP